MLLGVSLSVTVGPYAASAGLGLEPHPGFSAKVDFSSGMALSVKALLVAFSFSVAPAS